jgi:hypothetical protein
MKLQGLIQAAAMGFISTLKRFIIHHGYLEMPS